MKLLTIYQGIHIINPLYQKLWDSLDYREKVDKHDTNRFDANFLVSALDSRFNLPFYRKYNFDFEHTTFLKWPHQIKFFAFIECFQLKTLIVKHFEFFRGGRGSSTFFVLRYVYDCYVSHYHTKWYCD